MIASVVSGDGAAFASSVAFRSLAVRVSVALMRREKIANFVPSTYAMEKDYAQLRADVPAGFGWMTQDLHAAGALGDASLATAEKGAAALEHGARAFVALLHDVERFELPG